MSNPVSRVLSFKTVIYLRRISLYGSSRPSDYRPDKPIQSALLRMGFTWHKALPQCRWALTPPFHPYLPKGKRFISVALSLESPPPGFLRHPVLRSSDFPHGQKFAPATVQITQQWLFYHIILSVSTSGLASALLIITSSSFPNLLRSLSLNISVTILSQSKWRISIKSMLSLILRELIS